MNKIVLIWVVYFVYRLVRWFLDPYFKYKSRKQIKDYECFFNGKLESKKELGKPYLLRNETEMKNVELLGLGLVVPAYNEQNRLPDMLKTHIDYILEQQKLNKLPKKVEIVCVDDGSKDKTW